MASFSYEELSTPCSIRLLQVQVTVSNDIFAEMISTSIDSAPAYDALSYTWGDPISPFIPHDESHYRESFFMICNNQILEINANLRDALIAWHYADISQTGTSKSRYIWVDAVCINQSDFEEKATQVRFMDTIYQEADKVVAWLGPDDGTSSPFLTVVSSLSGIELNSLQWVIPEDMWRPQAQREKLGIQPLNYMNWLSWVAIMHRPYFKRVWIVQENYQAKQIVGLCGKHAFKWVDLISAWFVIVQAGWAQLLYTEQMISSHELPEPQRLGVFRKMMESKLDSGLSAWSLINGRATSRDKRWNFSQLIERHRTSLSSDPRDKIFALVGVARKNYRPFDTQPQLLEVSYDIDVETLYIRTARSLLLSFSDLSHLSIKESIVTRKINTLPSWVPDYTAEMIPDPFSKRVPGLKFSASGSLTWSLTEQALDDPLLHVQGRYIGTIEEYSMDPLLVTEDNIASFWRAICRMIFELPVPYGLLLDSSTIIPIESRIEILWRTLIADVFTGVSPAPPVAAVHFLEHMWMIINKELVLQHKAKRESDLGIRQTTENVSKLDQRSFDRGLDEFDRNSNTRPWGIVFNAEPEGSEYTFERFLAISERMRDALARDQGYVGSAGMLAWRREFNVACGRRRLFRTDTGLLGLGPIEMEMGDQVWVFAGADTPFMLRGSDTIEADNAYQLVGQTYVHGIMHGEAVEGIEGHDLTEITLV